MGSNESTLRGPPVTSVDELCVYPKRDKYWHCNPDSEAEIFYAKSGWASESHFKAITIPELLTRAARKFPTKPALRVERPLEELSALPKENGRPKIPAAEALENWKTWTFDEYLNDVRRAAKSMIALGFIKHDACNVFGFNSPEWFISHMASIFAGGKSAGIYPTDTPEQVKYKCDHANGAICVVDSQRNFDKVKGIVHQLPYLNAIVCWGDLKDKDYTTLTNGKMNPCFVLSWEDFLAYGEKHEVSDDDLDERINDIRPGHCSTIIYTSGTTGNPKAVMLSHDNCIFESYLVVCKNVDDFATNLEEERFLSYLPLSHVAGMMVDIISPLVTTVFLTAWACVYFARPYDLKAGSLVDRLQAVRPTLFLGVPRVWEKMADKLASVVDEMTGIKGALTSWAMNQGLQYTELQNYGYYDPKSPPQKPILYSIADSLVLSKVRAKLGLDMAKFTFTGAAPIQLETQRFLGKFGINVNEVYGMSEGTGGTTWSRHNCHIWGVAGYPMPTTELRVYQGDPMDVNDKKPAKLAENLLNPTEEEQGEICSRGRNIMMGYMANPRLGKEHIEEMKKKNEAAIDKDGFLHSEDKGTLSKSGFVKITGRFKELIIGAGGENIAPVPIEDDIKKNCHIISNIIMIGDQRKFNVALVTLKLEGATGENPGTNKLEKSFFKHVNGDLSTVDEALDDERVIKEITEKITNTNNNGDVVISNACKVQKFMILPRDVSINSGELTATLKLKRGLVAEKFKEVIDLLYDTKNREAYVRFPDLKFPQYYADYE